MDADARRPLGAATLAPPAPLQDDVRCRAEARLAARNAGLAISLADHAERVDRKRARGHVTQALSAADRLAALRRRLEERVRTRADVVAAAQAEADHSSGEVRTSNEDAKIHPLHVGGGIRSTTAWRPRDDREGVGEGAGAQDGVGGAARGSVLQQGADSYTCEAPVGAAIAAAARQVAWHTRDATARAEGGT